MNAGTPFSVMETAYRKVPGAPAWNARTADVPDITPNVPQVTTSTSSGVMVSPLRIRSLRVFAVMTTAVLSAIFRLISASVFIISRSPPL